MSYILIYEKETDHYDSCSTYWADEFDTFDTYEELIEFMAGVESRFHDQYKWLYIFKTDQNMRELYLDDVNKRYMEMLEQRMKKIEAQKALEAELEKEREAQYLIIQEERERALFEELKKKYGEA